EMLLTLARFLLQAIALHSSRVGLAILLPIIRMLFAPLTRALPARLTIVRIGRDLLSAVRGKHGKPKSGFHPSHRPWKSRCDSHTPTAPIARGKVQSQKQASHFPSA